MIQIIILMVIIMGEAGLTALLPQSKGYLFEMLSVKSHLIWYAILLFFFNYFFIDFFQSVKEYAVLKVATIYRTRRTGSVLYALYKTPKNHDNIPQRVQEDIKISYISRITVWCEYFISGVIVLQLIIVNISQPLLISCALLYTGISVILAITFKNRLSNTEKEVQKEEATFRFELKSLTKGLKFYGSASKATLRAGRIRMNYSLFTKLQLGLLNVLPFIILLPLYMKGLMDLGDVVKHQATFSLVVINSSILIQMYTRLIQGKASEDRVKELEK